MKQKKKIIILALVIIIAIILIIVFIKTRNNKGSNVQVDENGRVISLSPKLNETKKYNEFEITNLQVVSNENLTTISGDVKNVGDKETKPQYIGIKAYDDKGENIANFEAIVAPPGNLQGKIAPGDVITFNASTTERVTNIYDVEFVAPTQTEVVIPKEEDKQQKEENNQPKVEDKEQKEENNQPKVEDKEQKETTKEK